MVREVYDSLFFPSYLSFPLEGKSREAGKGVRGKAPIGCSITVLTANSILLIGSLRSPPYPGCAFGHAFGVRVDGASPRGLWPPDGGGLCRRVVKRKVLKMDGPSAQGFLSLTAFQAEGCGIALTVHSEHILKER